VNQKESPEGVLFKEAREDKRGFFWKQFDRNVLRKALTEDLASVDVTAALEKGYDLRSMILFTRSVVANESAPVAARMVASKQLREFTRMGAEADLTGDSLPQESDDVFLQRVNGVEDAPGQT
jgi:hypothetical protein